MQELGYVSLERVSPVWIEFLVRNEEGEQTNLADKYKVMYMGEK